MRHLILTLWKGLNYLIEVDKEGRLHWARNHEIVDTTAGHYKDSPNGGGIVLEDEPHKAEPNESTRQTFDASLSSLSLSGGSGSEVDQTAYHYAGDGSTGNHKWTAVFRKYFTVRGVANRMLRKTVKRNTWIYVTVGSLLRNSRTPNAEYFHCRTETVSRLISES